MMRERITDFLSRELSIELGIYVKSTWRSITSHFVTESEIAMIPLDLKHCISN
jgi:hypothetical protein